MRRITKTLMIIMVIIMSLSAPVSAMSEEIPETKYQEIDVYMNAFDISSSGIASCKVSLESQSSDRIVKVYAYIQRYENGRWITVKSGNASDDDGDVSIYMQLMVMPGYDYRLKSFAYVYQDNNLLEYDTYYSNNQSY